MKQHYCVDCGEEMIAYNITGRCDTCNHRLGRFNASYNNQYVRGTEGFGCPHNFYAGECSACGIKQVIRAQA